MRGNYNPWPLHTTLKSAINHCAKGMYNAKIPNQIYRYQVSYHTSLYTSICKNKLVVSVLIDVDMYGILPLSFFRLFGKAI